MSRKLLHSLRTTELSCGKCVKTLNDADKVLLCGLCDASFHILCLLIDVTTYTKISDLKGIVKWFCDDCNNRIEDLKVQKILNPSVGSAHEDIWNNNLGEKIFATVCAIERKLDEQFINVNKQYAPIVKSLNMRNKKINTATNNKNNSTTVIKAKKQKKLYRAHSDPNNKHNQLPCGEISQLLNKAVHEEIPENITKCEKDPLDISTNKGSYIKQEAVHTEELTENIKVENYLEHEDTKSSIDIVEHMSECSADTSVNEGQIEKRRSNRDSTLSSELLRLTERHFCEFVPPTPKKAIPYRHCAVCCSQRDENGKKRRKESRYYCRPCNVGLCAVPCFMIYHTKSNF